MPIPDLATRRAICEDTIARSPSITTSTPNASLTSSFIPAQLPPLTKKSPNYPNHAPYPRIKIHDSDTLALARSLASTSTSTSTSTSKTGILNLASDVEPGGGWRETLSQTQEEALCYSSTLYATLAPEWYPWPNTGAGCIAGIISPSVVIFRDTLENGLAELPQQERRVVAVMTVAAPRFPAVTADKEAFASAEVVQELREKIVLVLRMAASEGVGRLVLGAMGCGAYGCPPRGVAREMKRVLQEDEFSGWFERVEFAVYGKGWAGKRNLEVFREVFGGEGGE
jgi:uncharacterized protein (TIGR02452 family)